MTATTSPPPATQPEPTPTSRPKAGDRVQRTGRCPKCRAVDVDFEAVAVALTESKLVYLPPVPPACRSCQAAEYDAMQEADRIEREQRLARFTSSLRKRHKFATLEQVADRKPALAEALAEWHPTEGGLYLYGGFGVGKTFAAVAAARHAFEARYIDDIAFANVTALIEDTFAGIRDRSGRVPRFNFDHLRTVPLLILDDLGAEAPTPYVRSRVYSLVNDRYEQELPTIVTSNENLDTIAATTGGRVASRLAGTCRKMQLTGDDIRKQGGNR